MTDHQTAVLAAIRAADAAGWPMPSVRELMRACDISTTSVVSYTLRALARDGYVTFEPHKARSYRLTPKGRGAQSADELLLRRCLTWLEQQGGAVGGALVEDLRGRLA